LSTGLNDGGQLSIPKARL